MEIEESPACIIYLDSLTILDFRLKKIVRLLNIFDFRYLEFEMKNKKPELLECWKTDNPENSGKPFSETNLPLYQLIVIFS